MYIPRPIMDDQLPKLPKEVKFCRKCVMSNQRPRITFDENGICNACNYAEMKRGFDWDARKQELVELCDRHRSKDGSYDIIVPCSGGKDSSTIAYRLKYEYKMHPLCVTFSPPQYSQIGFENLRRFIDSGFDHVLASPNGKLNRVLSKLCFILLGDHNEIFDHGQYGYPFRVALQNNVKLVMYGENAEAEYGGTMKGAEKPTRDWSEFDECWFSNTIENIFKIGLEDGYFTEEVEERNLDIYQLPPIEQLEKAGVVLHFFGYYHHWTPQENYYFAAEHTGFQANPQGRNEGTYSKYAQLDDATDTFLYYLMYIKFGFGRSTSDSAHEIRDGHITREEAVALVHRYDGEFPHRNFDLFLKYLDITEDEFHQIVDRFRLPHIWTKEHGEWKLIKRVENLEP